jgi:DNA-binding transcriptional ArsR family regulator
MAKKERVGASDKELAELFKALADPTRIRIFRYLRMRCWPVTVEDGEEAWMAVGPTVGEVCSAVTGSKKITAKVSHHLKEMRLAELIAINRRGKHMICGLSQRAMTELAVFLEPPDVSELPKRQDHNDDADGRNGADEDLDKIEIALLTGAVAVSRQADGAVHEAL